MRPGAIGSFQATAVSGSTVPPTPPSPTYYEWADPPVDSFTVTTAGTAGSIPGQRDFAYQYQPVVNYWPAGEYMSVGGPNGAGNGCVWVYQKLPGSSWQLKEVVSDNAPSTGSLFGYQCKWLGYAKLIISKPYTGTYAGRISLFRGNSSTPMSFLDGQTENEGSANNTFFGIGIASDGPAYVVGSSGTVRTGKVSRFVSNANTIDQQWIATDPNPVSTFSTGFGLQLACNSTYAYTINELTVSGTTPTDTLYVLSMSNGSIIKSIIIPDNAGTGQRYVSTAEDGPDSTLAVVSAYSDDAGYIVRSSRINQTWGAEPAVFEQIVSAQFPGVNPAKSLISKDGSTIVSAYVVSGVFNYVVYKYIDSAWVEVGVVTDAIAKTCSFSRSGEGFYACPGFAMNNDGTKLFLRRTPTNTSATFYEYDLTYPG